MNDEAYGSEQCQCPNAATARAQGRGADTCQYHMSMPG